MLPVLAPARFLKTTQKETHHTREEEARVSFSADLVARPVSTLCSTSDASNTEDTAVQVSRGVCVFFLEAIGVDSKQYVLTTIKCCKGVVRQLCLHEEGFTYHGARLTRASFETASYLHSVKQYTGLRSADMHRMLQYAARCTAKAKGHEREFCQKLLHTARRNIHLCCKMHTMQRTLSMQGLCTPCCQDLKTKDPVNAKRGCPIVPRAAQERKFSHLVNTGL